MAEKFKLVVTDTNGQEYQIANIISQNTGRPFSFIYELLQKIPCDIITNMEKTKCNEIQQMLLNISVQSEVLFESNDFQPVKETSVKETPFVPPVYNRPDDEHTHSIRIYADGRVEDTTISQTTTYTTTPTYTQPDPDIIHCPKCNSTQITTGARGVNSFWGLIGASSTVNRCARCGHTWKPKYKK